MATQTYTNGVTLTDAGEFARFDTAAYPVLTGVAGTNTITGTGPANYSLSSGMPCMVLVPAASNTAATTINITPSGSTALGAKNLFAYGSACIGGELLIGVPTLIEYDGTQFNIVGRTGITRVTNALGSDVNLSNIANYFDGPSAAQGTVGTWFASGVVSLKDTAVAASFNAKLWDGTTVIASAQVASTGANNAVSIALSGYLSSPAANIRISVRDISSTSGLILFNQSGNSKDAVVSVTRIG